MSGKIDYTADRYCPVFGRVIDCDTCYEAVLGLSRAIKADRVKELDEVKDIESARGVCVACKYSDLE